MIKGRTLMILTVAGVVLAGAAWFLGRDQGRAGVGAGAMTEGRLLFPGLHDQLNAIRSIEITANDGAFTLELQGGVWLLAERGGYPADTRTVRRYLVEVARLKLRSPKTANPALYEKLDLNDPTKAGSRALAVVLRDAEGAVRASFIVGRSRPGASPERREHFVRLADDPQTWLVAGALSTPRTPPEWLMRDGFPGLQRSAIREVRVVHREGLPVVVMRAAAGDEFYLQGIPAGQQLASPYSLNDLVDLFVNARFDDVSPAAEVQFGGSKATMTTFDGVQVEMEQGAGAYHDYIRLEARAVGGASEGAGGEEREDDASAAADVTVAEPEPEAPEIRAEKLNQNWRNWAWRLSGFHIGNLTKPMAALLEAQETLEDPGAPEAPKAL